MKKVVSLIMSFIIVAMLLPLNTWATESQNIDFGVVEPNYIYDNELIKQNKQSESSQLEENKNSLVNNYSIPEEDSPEEDFAYTEPSETVYGEAITLNNAAPISGDIIASGYCGGEGDGTNLTWVLTDDGTLTISGEGEMKDYDKDYKNNGVTPSPWGEYADSLKTLVVEEGITDIGNYAFAYCSGFTGNLVIPDSVTTIGNSAFDNCNGFTGNLVIPDSVTTIGDAAFRSCDGFNGSLIIGNSVATINEVAFAHCGGFTGNLVIPNSVVTIGRGAFLYCFKITGELELSENISEIGISAFDSVSLSSINVSENNKNYCSIEGVLYSKDCKVLMAYPREKMGEFIIPEGVTTIARAAFSNCGKLTGSLVIPDSVVTIEEQAFYDSSFTGDLIIGDGVTTIGFSAFYHCDFTGELILGKNVTEIGNDAFSWCEKFSGDLIISKNLKSIGYEAFERCGINNYYFEGDAPSVFAATESNPTFDTSDTIYYPIFNTTWVIENGKWNGYKAKTHDPYVASGYCGGEGDGTNLAWRLDSYGKLTINGNGPMADYEYGYNSELGKNVTFAPWGIYTDEITSIVIENGITYIGKSAFYRLGNVVGNLIIPEGVTEIGDHAFAYCSGFSGNLTLPESLTYIGKEAFYYCYGFEGSLNLPDKVEFIGGLAFAYCKGFEGNILFGNNITKIGNYAFYMCVNFDGIVIVPQKVIEIGDYAFSDCGINRYYFEGDAPITGNYVFDASLDFVYYYANNDTWVIEDGKWENCKAIAGNEIIKFGSCGKEENEAGLIWRLTNDGILTISGKGDMADYGDELSTQAPWFKDGLYKEVKRLVFEEGITKIGELAFYGSDISGTVTIPEGVEYIAKLSFGYTQIELIEIPSTVTYIDNRAFENNYDLFEITISEKNSTYKIVEGVLFSKDGKILYQEFIRSENKYVVPEGTETIEEKAFYNFWHTGIILPESVKNVKYRAITNTNYVVCEGQLHSVEKGAFYVDDIFFMDGPPLNNEFSFDNCDINVLEGTEHKWNLDTEGLWNGYKVDLFWLNDNYEIIIGKGYCGDENDGTNLVWTFSIDGVLNICGKGKMSDGAQPWGKYNENNLIKKMVIEEGITRIGNGAFSGFKIKENLVIPDSVIEIGNYAFAYSKFTGELNIPQNVISIGEGAFSYCTGFTGDIIIPDSVLTIGIFAFEMCEGFNGKLIIGKGLSRIPDGAFADCNGLTGETIIQENIEAIDNYAFIGCGIDVYHFKGNAPEVGENAFDMENDTIYYPSNNSTWIIEDGKWNGYTAVAYNATLSISSEKLVSGGQTTVSVNLSEGSGVAAAQFSIKYDSSVLELVSASADELMADATINSATLGIIHFGWDDPNSVTEAGTILELTFTTAEGAGIGTTAVEIDETEKFVFSKANLEDLSIDIENGSITIIDAIYGDLTGDGEIDIRDAYMARLIAAKLNNLTDIQLIVGDVDGDGKITAIDANLIRKFAVKIISSLPVEM